MLTDYALQLLRKHEKRIAEGRKNMDLELLKNHIKQAKEEAYAATVKHDEHKKLSSVFPDELPLTFPRKADDATKEAESDVPCDASDDELIAFNDNLLKIGE